MASSEYQLGKTVSLTTCECGEIIKENTLAYFTDSGEVYCEDCIESMEARNEYDILEDELT